MGGTNDISSAGSESLSDLIDRLCDEFESRLRDGQRPRIENYLVRVEQTYQHDLLKELVGIELHWRRKRHEEIDFDEYYQRFPEHSDALELEIRTNDARHDETLQAGPLANPHAGEHEPARFGNYDLLEEIGRGGMGIVYRARQRTADRIVALKVIQRDRLDQLPNDQRKEILERFRNEAQAAARLEHDHIVTVYEVGEVDGQPFFSMRLVPGQSLYDLIYQGPLDSRTAASYLEPVARALHEAHACGILHRDLKPQNILVDAKSLRALVADFGLAKLCERPEEMTRAGEVVGTPSHMSPEQARDASQVTLLADVYALGATLYHTLTARPPFQASNSVETLRLVLHEEPVSPRQLNPTIDRDLETICLKCLEKESSKRYESAEFLADDLRRYLNGEPIRARRIGPIRRTWRWSRRNPVVSLLATAAALFFVVAFVSIVRESVRTQAARIQSETGFHRARQFINNLSLTVTEDPLMNQSGMQPVRRELLAEALNYYEDFLAHRGQDPSLRDELAATHFRVGVITEAIESPDKAMPSYLRARSLQSQLLEERPRDKARLQALGETLNRIGQALHRMQNLDEAIASYEEAIAIRNRLVDADSKDVESRRLVANTRMNLGISEMKRSNWEKAQQHIQRAHEMRVALLAEDPRNQLLLADLASGHFNQGKLDIFRQQDASAQQHFEKAIHLFERQLTHGPEDRNTQFRLAATTRLLADLNSEWNESDTALRLYEEARERMERLAQSNPKVVEYQAELASLYMNLGELRFQENYVDQSMDLFRMAIERLTPIVKQYPRVPQYRRDLATALLAIGLFQSGVGDYAPARDNLDAALEHFDRLVSVFPGDDEFAALQHNAMAGIAELDAMQSAEH